MLSALDQAVVYRIQEFAFGSDHNAPPPPPVEVPGASPPAHAPDADVADQIAYHSLEHALMVERQESGNGKGAPGPPRQE